MDFHGEKKTNETHVCRTDPEARLYRKSSAHPARLSHLGHALTENRHGLVLAVSVTQASGMAERLAAVALLDQLKSRQGLCPRTLGSDKGYDSGPFFVSLEGRGIEPHSAVIGTAEPDPRKVATHRKAGIAARQRMKERVLSVGSELSQRCRKKVEESFGGMKTVGRLDRSRWVGRWKLRQQMELTAAAYNLVRMRKLLATG